MSALLHFGCGPNTRSIAVLVISHVPAAFRISSSVKRGAAFLYLEQAYRTLRLKPKSSAASAIILDVLSLYLD